MAAFGVTWGSGKPPVGKALVYVIQLGRKQISRNVKIILVQYYCYERKACPVCAVQLPL